MNTNASLLAMKAILIICAFGGFALSGKFKTDDKISNQSDEPHKGYWFLGGYFFGQEDNRHH